MAARARQCRARVAAVRRLAAEILEADLDMQDPPALEFEAGQWVSVPFGPKIVRAYSIASTPLSPGRITLCADVAPGGLGSRWFRGLEPGDEVEFKGPVGGFVVEPADPRRLLLVAEEIGIVPIRSILAWLHAAGGMRPARLVYWARDPSWLVYDAEFRALAARAPDFAYDPVVAAEPRPAPATGDTGSGAAAAPGSRDLPRGSGAPVPGHGGGQAAAAERGWSGRTGGLAETVAEVAGDVRDLVAYVAGSGEAINRVRGVLMARGLERKAVKWEKFW